MNANTSLGQVKRPTTSGQLCLAMALNSAVPGPLPWNPRWLPAMEASRGLCGCTVCPAPDFRGIALARLGSWTGISNSLISPQGCFPPHNPTSVGATPECLNVTNLYPPHPCTTCVWCPQDRTVTSLVSDPRPPACVLLQPPCT